MEPGLATRYARSADGTYVAYQMNGEGPVDLVLMHGTSVPIDLMWDHQGFSRIGKRLLGFSRVIWLEHRGVGSSGGDPVDSARGAHLVDDMTAVLDDVGIDRVVVVASSTSGQNAITFAADRPNRVESLILVNTYAHYLRDHDCLFGMPAEKLEVWLERAELTWGTDANVAILAPSQIRDERFCEWWCRCSRLGLTPRQLTDMTRACFPRDERPRLASVTMPSLVLHRQGDRYIHADAGRYLAEHIPNSKFVLLPGDDHLMFVGDVDGLVDEIEQFITGPGGRRGAGRDPVHRHREFHRAVHPTRAPTLATAPGAARRARSQRPSPSSWSRDQDDGRRVPGHF